MPWAVVPTRDSGGRTAHADNFPGLQSLGASSDKSMTVSHIIFLHYSMIEICLSCRLGSRASHRCSQNFSRKDCDSELLSLVWTHRALRMQSDSHMSRYRCDRISNRALFIANFPRLTVDFFQVSNSHCKVNANFMLASFSFS